MTRGNQRDKDRERAAARAKGGNKNSTIKGADDTANIMREKQRLAEEKKKVIIQKKGPRLDPPPIGPSCPFLGRFLRREHLKFCSLRWWSLAF